MADVEAAVTPVDDAPLDGEQPEAEEAEVQPAASPALAPLYGKHSFPACTLAPEVPVSAVIAACWPEKDAQVSRNSCSRGSGSNLHRVRGCDACEPATQQELMMR